MHVLPNLVVGLFVSVASIDNSIVARSAEPFYVVTTSNGSENLYLNLSRLRALSELSHVREDTICDAILSSPFLSNEHELEMVDPNNRAYARFHPEMKEWLMLRRPYETFNVSVPPNVIQSEAVFPCLGKLEGENKVKMFLVSKAYDLYRSINKEKLIECPQATGHFVFEYRKNENVAQLMAIAEEPVDMLGSCFLFPHMPEPEDVNVEINPDTMGWYFVGVMGTRGRDICEFARGRKVHICTVALYSEEFRSYVRFSPLEDRIDSECEKRGLLYRRTECRENEYEASDIEFSEWVIGCQTDPFVSGETTATTYYVSLGYQPYQFYIYHTEPGNSNVSILIHHFYSYLGVDNPEWENC